MAYSKSQITFLHEMREQGLKWKEVADTFNEKFATSITGDSARKACAHNHDPEAGRSHLLIPDTQVKPGTPTHHIEALGRFIAARKPDVIVAIGDWWDMESLSSYDVGKKCEGRRVKADIECGNEAMQILVDAIKAIPKYSPRMVFTLGNHEERIARHINANPELEDFLGYDHLNLSDWEVHDFLKVVEIDGVHYSHYFSNPMSGRPYGGTVMNVLKNVGYSFTMGHQQALKIGRLDLSNGEARNGLVAGAFYLHDEDYKGHQGNPHWRGIVYKHNVRNGDYDIEVIGLNRLLKEYGQ